MASSPQQPNLRSKWGLPFGILMFVLGFFTGLIIFVVADFRARQVLEVNRRADRIHATIPVAQYCGSVFHCGDVIALTCFPDLDGPLDYYDNTTGNLLME